MYFHSSDGDNGTFCKWGSTNSNWGRSAQQGDIIECVCDRELNKLSFWRIRGEEKVHVGDGLIEDGKLGDPNVNLRFGVTLDSGGDSLRIV